MKNESSTDEELIARLRRKESLAFYDILRIHTPAILRHLEWKWGKKYADEINSAATDAFMVLVTHPDRYDPSKSALETFLINIATKKMISGVDKLMGKKRSDGTRGKFSASSVEVDPDQRNKSKEGSPLSQLETKEQLELILTKVEGLIPDEPDLTLAIMVLKRERETSEYAPILGITHLEESEQRKIVNQTKDRLKKQMQRHGIYDYIKKLKGL